MTISTPGKPDKVSTVESDINETAILQKKRKKSVNQLHQAEVVCLEQDGVGKGKAIEPPMATTIGHDEQYEEANESHAAGSLHMDHQNHVKEVNTLEENSSTGDQTATISGESNKFIALGCDFCTIRSHHMVRNKLCWGASYTVGLPN